MTGGAREAQACTAVSSLLKPSLHIFSHSFDKFDDFDIVVASFVSSRHAEGIAVMIDQERAPLLLMGLINGCKTAVREFMFII